MSKEYVFTILTIGILLAIAIFGYALPDKTRAEPVRILFDNAGGKVIFDHKAHVEDYFIDCQSCHHESLASNPSPPMACGDCHGVAITDAFREDHTAEYTDEACVTCHHVEFTKVVWDHEAHTGYADCTTCHHDPEISPEPVACSSCHDSAGDEKKPSLRDASHLRCQSCHVEMLEEKMTGCASCHESDDQRAALKNGVSNAQFSNCSSCHYEEKVTELILDRMSAFHKRCMGCHEEVQSGPFAKDQCNQCHFR